MNNRPNRELTETYKLAKAVDSYHAMLIEGALPMTPHEVEMRRLEAIDLWSRHTVPFPGRWVRVCGRVIVSSNWVGVQREPKRAPAWYQSEAVDILWTMFCGFMVACGAVAIAGAFLTNWGG